MLIAIISLILIQTHGVGRQVCWCTRQPVSACAGGQAAAFLHLARAVCRRAERSVVLLVSQGACESGVAVYLNRLSDYLFTVARIASRKAQQPETVYKKT